MITIRITLSIRIITVVIIIIIIILIITITIMAIKNLILTIVITMIIDYDNCENNIHINNAHDKTFTLPSLPQVANKVPFHTQDLYDSWAFVTALLLYERKLIERLEFACGGALKVARN